MQHVEDISCLKLPFFGKLVKDYLSDKAELSAFYSHRPDYKGLLNALDQKSFPETQRRVLVESLYSSYGKLLNTEGSNAVVDNLEKLKEPDTFTITTGHQLCAYGGPAYFIYKIASVIKVCLHMKVLAPEKHFVPVFWLASEDHDFEEISNLHLWGKTWNWNNGNESSVYPVGRMVPGALAAWGEELNTYFRGEAVTSSVVSLFSRAYEENKTLSDATRQAVHELFKAYGLVIVDGDAPQLKGAFKDIFRKELLEQGAFKALSETSSALKNLGYEPQVNGREVNLFLFNESGERERIEPVNGGYRLARSGAQYTQEQLLALLELHPENFSPNVVLRPVFQEYVLPNIAYIGGPGEVAYWLQLKKVFTTLEVPFPAVLLRSSHVVVPASQFEWKQKNNISTEQFLTTGYDELVKVYLDRENPDAADFSEEEAIFLKTVSLLKQKAGSIDKNLTVQIDIEYKAWLDSLSKLKARFNKALKNRSENDLKQLKRIKNTLMPEGVLQERRISIMEFISGNPDWLQQIVQHSDPAINELHVFIKE